MYLTPKRHRMPLAHWGVARRKQNASFSGAWEQSVLRNEGPHFLQKADSDPFEAAHVLPEVFDDFRHALKPLAQLDSQESLDRLVLAPIRCELESLSEPKSGSTAS
jgi:hypothetical protein